MLSFILVLLSTIILSFVPERLLQPLQPLQPLQLLQPRAAKTSAFTLLLQSLLVSLLFLTLTLIVQRPIFSGIAIIVFLFILVIVSNAKYTALREPMVFSDIAMFSQAFKHPRLYFPFLGLTPVILGPLIIIGLIYTVLTLEPALSFTWQRISATVITIAILWFLIKQLALTPKLTLSPEKDNAQFGLFNTLWCYAFQANTKEHKQAVSQILNTSPFAKDNSDSSQNPSNITVIQSESFFDARRLHPNIKQSILENFDQCKQQSRSHGKLKIPAWGANTMRSEFSFLTGLSSSSIGFYQFYPYQYLSKTPLFTIASQLQKQGYYCVCIHPHPASFFGRDQIFPKMGFDEFIDIDSFDQSKTFGPYISDQAVTDKIIEITQQKTDKPLFIFAITMENHGPLHLEKVKKEELATYYTDENNAETSNNTLKGLDDLTVYLRHLKNADNMIQQLTTFYTSHGSKHQKGTTFCFYGDHVPSMPLVYSKTGYQDDSSDYLIWCSDSQHHNEAIDLNIESLAINLL